MARPICTAALLAASLLILGAATTASARPFIIDDLAPSTDAAAAVSQCGLLRTGAERSNAGDCTSCHAAAAHATHPVEMDYEQARLGGPRGRDLRPVSELRSRGIRLVGGKVTCVTCHDASSRVAHHLAIPGGALVRPAVNVRNQATYAWPSHASRVEHVAAGAAVSPTALCKACHALD